MKITLVVSLLLSPLFLWGLGDTYLWTDEAQTARLGQSVLANGVPMTGTGSDSVTAHCGDDSGVGGLHLQIPWLQAYLVALSIGVIGPTSLAARLPFALLGWACVPLSGWLCGLLGGRRLDRLFAMLLVGTSVYFILHARQARYYGAAAFLVLLAVGAYVLATRDGNKRWLLATSLVALVLTFDVTALGVLAALMVHSVVSNGIAHGWAPRRGLRALRPFVVPVLVLAGWILVASTAASRQQVQVGGQMFVKLLYYGVQINAHLAPLLIVVPIGLLMLWRGRRDARLRALGFVATVCAAGLLAAAAPPLTFPRYFVAMVPVVLVGVGLLLGSLAELIPRGGRSLAWISLLLVIAGVPQKLSHDFVRWSAGVVGFRQSVWHPAESWVPALVDLSAELIEPPRGPLAAVVEYLESRARGGEAIVTTYGLPALRYHTVLDPYGGRTCEFPQPGRHPEWIWLRAGWDMGSSAEALAWVDSNVDLSRYQRIELAAADRRWENREDFHEHVFRNPGPVASPTVLYRLIEGDGR